MPWDSGRCSAVWRHFFRIDQFRLPYQCQPGQRQRVTLAEGGKCQRDTRVGLHVSGMQRQARREEERRTIRLYADIGGGRIGITADRIEGRERRCAGCVQDIACHAHGLEGRTGRRFDLCAAWGDDGRGCIRHVVS